MQTLDLLLLADGTARSASPEWNRLVGNFHHIAWTAVTSGAAGDPMIRRLRVTIETPAAALDDLRRYLRVYDTVKDLAERATDEAVDFDQLKQALGHQAVAKRAWDRLDSYAQGVAGVLGGDPYDFIAAAREAVSS